MTRIIPVPTGRTSDMLLSQRLNSQLASDQSALLRLQTQLSTGRRVLSLSDDAPAAIRGLTLQSLLERKEQISTNLVTSQSYLSATDVALSHAANTLNDVRGLAVSLADTTFSDTELAAAGEQIERAIQQMLDIANQQFRGRQLFAGSNTTTPPFEEVDGLIEYLGNTSALHSFADVDLLFDTTVNGDTAFGAISKEVRGISDLNPVLRGSTQLANLRGGKGIDRGSFQISDGITPPVTIDISSATTVNDVVRLIESNPPTGRTLTARITDTGLVVDIDDAGGGNLTIKEVGGSRVAAQLGILDTDGNLTNPIVGAGLDPIVTLTTPVEDLLGTRAKSIIEYPGVNNDIIVTANRNGASLNDIQFNLVDDNLVKAGNGISRGNEFAFHGEDLLRPQATLNLSGADNSLLLTSKATDGSLDGVQVVVDASNNIGNSAIIGPVTDVAGVPTITVQVDDSDETTLQTLVNAFGTDGRFAVGIDTSTGEGYNPTAAVAATNDGLVTATSITTHAVKARASLAFVGGGNDLQLIANQAGDSFNDVEIVVDATGNIGDAATATYSDDGTTRRLTISIDDTSETTVETLINAIVQEGTFSVAPDPSKGETFNLTAAIDSASNGNLGNTGNTGGPSDSYYIHISNGTTTTTDLLQALNGNSTFATDFTAAIDPKDTTQDFLQGSGVVSTTVIGQTAGGSGDNFDNESGVQITNGSFTTVLSFEDAETVEDILNVFNGSNAGLVAEINANGNGINVRSRLSGGNFSIGENGGETATQLGIRTLTEETSLSNLNFGLGVRQADGTDFTITRNDDVELEIDLSTAKTLGDVLNLINNHPDNLDTNPVVARLAEFGNGIELVDDNPPGFGRLRITQDTLSNAATDLGLIPDGLDEITVSDSPDAEPATAIVEFPPPGDLNTAIRLEATAPGTSFNNVRIEFVNNIASGNQALVDFDPSSQVLTVDVDPALTSANTVIAAITAEGTFDAERYALEDGTNSGSGLITATGVLATTNGGTAVADAEAATADISFPAPDHLNTEFTLTARIPGTARNDVRIVFDDSLTPGGTPSAVFNLAAKTLTVQIEAGVTTTNEVISAIDVNGNFDAQLKFENDSTNDGSGLVPITGTVGTTSGGTAEVLRSTDVNPQETKGVFNSLLRLKEAISNKDTLEISRVAQLLDEDIQRLSFARGELGARDQHVDVLKERGVDEVLELEKTLSLEIEVDFVQAISDMTARQASYQASLQTIGQLYQLTLLDFI